MPQKQPKRCRLWRNGGSCVRLRPERKDHVWSYEFTAQAVWDWPARIGVESLYIEPGSPWENGDCESFNGKLRDQFLNGEIFYTLKEAKVLLERWRWHDKHVRPHSFAPPSPPGARRAPSPRRSPTHIDFGTGKGGSVTQETANRASSQGSGVGPLSEPA